MRELFFVLKCLTLTTCIVLFLQIKWGSRTLEEHTHLWIQSSSFTNQFRESAQGASLMIQKFLGQPIKESSNELSQKIQLATKPIKTKIDYYIQSSNSKNSTPNFKEKKETLNDLKDQQEKAMKRIIQ